MWGPVLFLNKLSNSAKKYKYVLIFWANQKNTETFRCEKSAWNNNISGTREFWDPRLKTKSWNFEEVRWRPYSPKESFLYDFVFNLRLGLKSPTFSYLST